MMWAWSLEIKLNIKTFHRVKAEPSLTRRLLEVLALNLQYILVLFRKKDSDKSEQLLKSSVLASPWTGRPPPPPPPQIINKSHSADVFRLRWFSGMWDWWWELNLLGVCGTWRQHKDKITLTDRRTDIQRSCLLFSIRYFIFVSVTWSQIYHIRAGRSKNPSIHLGELVEFPDLLREFWNTSPGGSGGARQDEQV